jgi:hypothetical protein
VSDLIIRLRNENKMKQIIGSDWTQTCPRYLNLHPNFPSFPELQTSSSEIEKEKDKE